jgi:hypothetical protein
MGAAEREWVASRFGMEAVTDQWVSIYDELLDRRERGRGASSGG